MKLLHVLLFSAIIFGLTSFDCFSQSIVTFDIVTIDNRYEKEAMYFYNENWKKFREEAIKQGFISGFEMLKTETDEKNTFQLFLITRYPDSETFKKMEENFGIVMKKISPNGPKMLNEIPRNRFVVNITGYDAASLIKNE